MKNKKPIFFIALLFVFCIVVGGTIAYYMSSDTFSNAFNTGKYGVTTQEVFESPDNWTPGTTTPKNVHVTNNEDTPVAVRIKL
jgi:alternate signal-mediated exported protein